MTPEELDEIEADRCPLKRVNHERMIATIRGLQQLLLEAERQRPFDHRPVNFLVQPSVQVDDHRTDSLGQRQADIRAVHGDGE